MTQDQLAHACDIDPSNLRAYENGRGLPNVYTVVRISAALMLERPGDLLDGLTTELFTPRNQ
jgi:transcriptional regulator with XRE-family HTH domain